MTPQDPYYDLVRNALRQQGWRITHNPLPLRLPPRQRRSEQDEAVLDRILAAEKDERKIAVVVKSFIGHHDMADLHKALERLTFYRARLHVTELDRVLYLAVRQATYQAYVAGTATTQLLAHQPVLLMVFDPRTEAIIRWDARFPEE